MKVLYFTRGQSPHDLRFTQALSQTEHQVFVLCLESDHTRSWPEGITEVQWNGAPADFEWKLTARLVRELKDVIEQVKPDLIHAGPIQRVAFLVAQAKFHPLVSMSWGSDLLLDAQLNLWWSMVTRYALTCTDVLVADCESVIKKARKFGFRSNAYKLFPWGVDLDHFSPTGSADLREKLGWQGKTVLLSNRSWEPLYGVDVILAAFIKACQANPDLRLMLFGRGSQETKIRSRIDAAGLNEKVYYGGFASRDQLPDIYRSTDLYLSASHSDGSSVSLMEALACALPVVVSDIPGNLEWVTEGQQGWLFKDKNSNQLAEKILQAVSAREQWQEMKNNNRKLAEQRADWKKNFPVLLEAYQMAAASCPKGGSSL